MVYVVRQLLYRWISNSSIWFRIQNLWNIYTVPCQQFSTLRSLMSWTRRGWLQTSTLCMA